MEIEMKSANYMGDILEYEEDLDGEEGREQAKMKMEQRKLIETIKSIMSSKER